MVSVDTETTAWCVDSLFRHAFTNFVSGSKVGYTFTPGFPAVRLHAAKRFTEQDGFASLLLAMQHASFAWPGGEALLVVLKILNIGEVCMFILLLFVGCN